MIPPLLLYLLKTQVALLLLLGVYYGLLRRLTFHQLNRAYLLAALGLAALYPVLDLSSLRPAVAPSVPLAVVLPTWPAAPGALPVVATGPTSETWLLMAYGLGVAVLLVLLLVQGASLWRLHRASRPAQLAGLQFRAVAGEVSPFSFGRAIYLNPAHHAPAELPTILLHERVHVRQAHTLDVLLGHLHRMLAWASPAAWLWLRAAQENLEFIADAAVLHESQLAPKQYQYSLVRLSTLAAGPALVTPFSFITLKNRIRMMNSLPSGRRQLLRYAAGFTLLTGLAVGCATPKQAELPKPVSSVEQQAQTMADQAFYFVDGLPSTQAAARQLDPAALKSMHVLKGRKFMPGFNEAAFRQDFGEMGDKGVILLVTKEGENSDALRAFHTKYNITFQGQSPQDKTITEALVAGKKVSAAELQGRLLVVDGVEMPLDNFSVPAGSMKSVYVLDAEQAVKKYGEKGRQGAVLITTK
ncbi:M56 family metallopeptidase [Hymenobacter endophyticus]|uniref:M56 family metallopeptidase n=1 Tax=Hymenobacter endophyticus TaxID=3076335 RepID=A0ABU3TGX5_9BACT|nr:M56 family metallopeptidase [Hymenobacter endophyticus]MDU0370636.1 M56 family metallopeptidase [Hymenobacter endophyticus]